MRLLPTLLNIKPKIEFGKNVWKFYKEKQKEKKEKRKQEKIAHLQKFFTHPITEIGGYDD